MKNMNVLITFPVTEEKRKAIEATLICRPMPNPVDLSQKRYEDHGFVRG